MFQISSKWLVALGPVLVAAMPADLSREGTNLVSKDILLEKDDKNDDDVLIHNYFPFVFHLKLTVFLRYLIRLHQPLSQEGVFCSQL